MTFHEPTLRWTAIFLWGMGLACGLSYAIAYQYTPAQSNLAPDRWPLGTSCTLAADRPTLVMFVHPRCPCSRASLNELAILMTRCHDRLATQVLFFKPGTVETHWVHTDLWSSAEQIPNVVPRIDFEGNEQRYFNARTSGEVFVYLPTGDVLFHGGITAGRGHVGDNVGRSRLESLLLRDERAICTTPVFGCDLSSAGTDP